MSVFCPILLFIAPYHYEKIKAYNYVSKVLARFARAYKLLVYDFFFYVGTFGGLPPPPYQKAGYATVASFRTPEEWPNEDGRFRPPHSLHEIAATGVD